MISILNNEALALIAIQAVLNKSKSINIANSYLIAPLLLDRKINSFFKRKNTNVMSTQEVVTAKSDYFIGFNDKYMDSLVVTTNAIAMGIELGVFMVEGSNLCQLETFSLVKGDVGKKVDDIVSASMNASTMLSESPRSVYSLLRIEL